MFCHTCDLEIKSRLYNCPFCGGPLSVEPAKTTAPHPGPQAAESIYRARDTDGGQAAENVSAVSVLSERIDSGGGKSEERPRTRRFPPRRLLIPGGIAAALILIAMLAMNFANKGFTQAFKVLCGDIETRVGASVFAVSGPLSRCLENGEVYTDISYTDEYGDTISGILSYASDSGAHRLSLDARIYGNPLDAVLLVNEDHAALGSSLLGDSYFGVRFDTFAEDFAKFADIAGLSGVSADGYAEIVRMIDCAFNGGASLSAGTAAQLKKILTDFLSGLKSCESREKMSSGGRAVTSSVLTYTATVSDLADLGDRLVSSARSDESMRSFLTAYMRSQGIYEDYGYAAVPDPAASVSTLNSFHTVEASEPVDYFLDELEYLLKAARENCSGDISVRLISIKGRFSAIELSAEVYAEGEPLSVWLQLDFGQSVYDDWTLDCYVHTPHDACGLGAIWSYSDTDGTAVNEITFTAGDSGFNDTIVLCSQWEAQSGSFSLRLSGVPGTYGSSNNFYFAIQGTLIYDDDGFSLALDTTPQLRLGITGAADCSIAQAEFINLDEWDRDTLVHFERALLKLYASIYSYPSIL